VSVDLNDYANVIENDFAIVIDLYYFHYSYCAFVIDHCYYFGYYYWKYYLQEVKVALLSSDDLVSVLIDVSMMWTMSVVGNLDPNFATVE
jgi:hypothetical protein